MFLLLEEKLFNFRFDWGFFFFPYNGTMPVLEDNIAI